MARQIPELVAESWTGAIEKLYRDSWDASIQRHRSPFVFRGMPDAAADLSTSLLRLSGGNERTAKLEGHILRNFRKYGHPSGFGKESVWTWLARAQHYGLQTRLLDWTYSPMIALHFATVQTDLQHLDGVVWMVDHRKTVELLPAVFRNQAAREGSNAFTIEMLEEAAPSLEVFDGLSKQDDFVVFLEPPSIDARIANQLALFSLMSSPITLLDEWLKRHPGCARRVIIPAGLKREFRDKLDQAGIHERTLFPGLDGLARWLSRYYSPAGPG